MLAASSVPDAAQFKLDITGSTVDYPANGTATINLIDSTTNTIQASRVWGWVRNGNIITLSDPDAVNTWAANSGGTADKLTYSITKFQSDYGTGEQTISVASQYEGQTTTSTTTIFESCAPRGVYTNQPCRQ